MKSRKENFAKNLKEIREFLGITQYELCERCSYSQCAISNFESGRRAPGLKNIVKIANALGVSTDRLIFGGSK